jgi:hypothetical protein
MTKEQVTEAQEVVDNTEYDDAEGAEIEMTDEEMQAMKDAIDKNKFKVIDDGEGGFHAKKRKIDRRVKVAAIATGAAVTAAGVGYGVAVAKGAVKAPAGLSRAMARTKLLGGKYAPLAMTVIGVAGFGFAAWEAYKSRDKVRAVVEGMEDARENGEEINKFQVVKDMSNALYKPVLIGLASAGMITASYFVMNRRLGLMTSAFAAASAEAKNIKDKVIAEYGEEKANEIFNTETQEVTTVDEDGNEKTEVRVNASDANMLTGRWFMDSQEYASDDHQYNREWIKSKSLDLDNRLAINGYVTMNQVLDALGFERTKAGALFGWSFADGINITTTTTEIFDEESGEMIPQIYIRWNTPRSIYDEMPLEGRYSVFG